MSRTVAALDLGGTHISAGRIDLEQVRVDEWVRIALPPAAGRQEMLERIVGAAIDVAVDVDAIGFAVPGPFDYANGVSRIGHKLEALYGVDLRAALAGALGLVPQAISFVNDADAFALGEWWAGAAKGRRRVVGVTFGTGLGSAFLADGKIVDSGPCVPPSGEIHRVPYRGRPVEESVSRGALIRRYGDSEVDVEEIASRARSGDEQAVTAFEDVATALGEVFEPWLRAFDATCLVVGGSISAAWDLLLPGLRSTLDGLDQLETIVRASLLDHAALLGAAYHASEHLGPPSTAMGIRQSRSRASNRLLLATDQPDNAGERLGRPADKAATRAVEDPASNRLLLAADHAAAMRKGRLAAGARPLRELTVVEARAMQAAEQAVPSGDSYELDTRDLDGPVPIRLYRPRAADPLPLCVWLPGGGWVLDTLVAAEPVCRRIAAETPCAVAAVRYRLAPEHPFPIPVEDCLNASLWLLEHATTIGLDPQRVAIGGTSAGGNLAAAVTLLARERRELDFAVQLLVYPIVHYGARHEESGDETFDARDVDWCWSHYLERPEDGSNPLASPLLADDLAGLPRALIVTAELDPLRDEAEGYAARLRRAGTPAEIVRFDGVPHGFFSQEGVLDAADEAQLAVIDALRAAFAATM